MKVSKRNREAEIFERNIIPKNTLALCGIVKVEYSEGTVQAGKGARKDIGRHTDIYKVTVQVVSGPFKAQEVSAKVIAHVDYKPGRMPDPYGNSKKFCELCSAIFDGVGEEDILTPETAVARALLADDMVGKLANVEFGTFSFESDRGEKKGQKMEVNTFLSFSEVNGDTRQTFKADIDEFQASVAASTPGGAFDSGEEDDSTLPY